VEQAGVSFKTNLQDALPRAAAFPFALRRALLNVLMNAIQFAPKGSEITVTLAHCGASVVTDVLDRGPGIPADMRKRVFDMFVTGRPEGTGLGLFLARTAIRRCGGDIQALARTGGGADIRITLPVATGHVSPLQPCTGEPACSPSSDNQGQTHRSAPTKIP
jgi:signal transduction histidine kinase